MIGPNTKWPARVTDASEWWRVRATKYPFHAIAPTSIRPEWVKGNHASCIMLARTGWRKWGFETKLERDQFCEQFGGTCQ